ncbi:MAG: InlB B-repeat-containing protein [Treponema sp.]|nr:InlB B-repeat-containing protein [Treponema sp.]
MKKGLIIFAAACAIITGITFASCSNMLEDLRNAGKKIILVSGYKGETIEFGSWPQSEVNVTGIDLTETGKTYDGHKEYSDGNNNYYVKVEDKYYKVEPITWRIIAYYSDGRKLLLADKIYSRIPYYGRRSNRDLNGTTIYPNNYKYSNIRAYLNSTRNQFEIDGGSPAEYDVDWAGKGFLTSAFTGDELAKIKTTAVDNSVASTGYDSNEYACENTEDKVYLLSYKEATNPLYGLSNDEDRIMQTTDYARANGAYQSKTEGYGGFWWLRSPGYSDSDDARGVEIAGNNYRRNYYVDDGDVGVVPALIVNNVYTVTFDTDGGSTVSPQTVNKGEKVVKPAVPIKTDDEDNLYEFLGWYNGKKKYDFSATVKEDITLKAKWNKIKLDSGYKEDIIEFGSWPQSEVNVTGITLTETSKTYDGYKSYSDNDGNYYVEVGDKYYKVEPIKWRIIAYYSDGRKLLLADKIYSRIPYYGTTSNRDLNGTTIYPNNYKYSNIRAYLNSTRNQFEIDGGSPTEYDVDWAGKGFLTSAFTDGELEKIKTTAVDNSVASTGYDSNEYACENTEDKVFLMSYRETQNELYGLGNNEYRIMQATDYARANGAGGYWWLRSPHHGNSNFARRISRDGDRSNRYVYDDYVGVVPALMVNNLYTVTFDTDGGSIVPLQTVSKGEKAHKPDDPTKTDAENNLYKFQGWYNGETKYDFDSPVNSDITLKAKWATVSYNVGDIIFSDGNSVAYTSELTLTEAQKQNAIAVIYKVAGGKAYGVGLAHNRDGLAWCSDSANAYGKNIESIQCKPDDGGSEGNYTFNNVTDKDGSNNLTQIAQFLSSEGSGTSDDTEGEGAAERYPAFYFAKNYAEQPGSHVSGTAYKSGWYLPTLAELFDIYKEIATVDAALDKCGGSKFDDEIYWSSSQYASYVSNAYLLGFGNGYWGNDVKKGKGCYVCCIRAFN